MTKRAHELASGALPHFIESYIQFQEPLAQGIELASRFLVHPTDRFAGACVVAQVQPLTHTAKSNNYRTDPFSPLRRDAWSVSEDQSVRDEFLTRVSAASSAAC